MVAQRKRQFPCNQRVGRVVHGHVSDAETKRDARAVCRCDGDRNIRSKTLDEGEKVLLSLQTRLQLEVALFAPSLPDIRQVETVHLGQRLNLSVMARSSKHSAAFLLDKVDHGLEKQDLFWSEDIDPDAPDGQLFVRDVLSYLTHLSSVVSNLRLG